MSRYCEGKIKVDFPVWIGKKRRKAGFRRIAGLEGLAE